VGEHGSDGEAAYDHEKKGRGKEKSANLQQQVPRSVVEKPWALVAWCKKERSTLGLPDGRKCCGAPTRALHVHEVGVGRLHKPLELVAALLRLLRGVKKILSELCHGSVQVIRARLSYGRRQGRVGKR
jgi:hypothetical protein